VALLEYSPSTHTLETVSIHFFERPEFKSEHLKKSVEPVVHVDPQNKCALLQVYQDFIAVIPFKQQEDDPGKKPYEPSFIMALTQIDRSLRNVIDMCFLHGYYEPTLAILYDPFPTADGKLSQRKDTQCLMIVSFDLQNRIYTCIYKAEGLPYNCWKMYPVPKPTGGILVASMSCLLHLDQVSPGCGVGVNRLSPEESNFSRLQFKQVNLDITLNGCLFQYLENDNGLLILRNGDLFIVQFSREGRFFSSIHLEKVGTSVIPSCSCLMDDKHFFLGSKISDSLLIKYERKRHVEAENNEVDDELLFLETANSTNAGYQFSVVDSLLSLGPIKDFAIGEPSNKSISPDPTRRDLELVLCSGYAKNGALAILSTSIRPNVLSTFDFMDCQQLFSVEIRDFTKYIVISRKHSSMILQTENEEIQQVVRSDFNTTGPTLFATGFDNKILQVTQYSVLLLDADANLIQDVRMNYKIVRYTWSKPYLVLVLENQRVSYFVAKADRLELTEIPSRVNEVATISCSAFYDRNGHFVTIEEYQSKKAQGAKGDAKKDDYFIDDLDRDLYGDSIMEDVQVEETEEKPETRQGKYYCVLYRNNGAVEVKE
jgi:cleavage and polyadenylation specificity factor subunit 1